MVVEILGDGFDRTRGRLNLLEGFEQPLPSKRLHRSDAHCQVKETIELARADSEQIGKISESDSLR